MSTKLKYALMAAVSAGAAVSFTFDAVLAFAQRSSGYLNLAWSSVAAIGAWIALAIALRAANLVVARESQADEPPANRRQSTP